MKLSNGTIAVGIVLIFIVFPVLGQLFVAITTNSPGAKSLDTAGQSAPEASTIEVPAEPVAQVAEQVAPKSVNLTLNAKVEGTSVVGSGSADLPDGTLISYGAYGPEKEQEGLSVIESGSYRFSIDISSWQPGEIEIWAAFQTVVGSSKAQPKEVIDMYGKNGEHIPDGKQVGQLKRIEQTRKLTKPKPVSQQPASNKAPAQPSVAGASLSCDPNYDPCIPKYPPDLNCSDIGHSVRVIGSDPHKLDRDKDGIACE